MFRRLALLISRSLGRNGEVLRELYTEVKSRATVSNGIVVLFLGELTTVVNYRETFESNISPNTEALLQLLEGGALANSDPEVITIASTTRPYQLAPSIRTCFETQVFVDFPSRQGVESTIKSYLQDMFEVNTDEDKKRVGDAEVQWAKYWMTYYKETTTPLLAYHLRDNERMDKLGITHLGYTLSNVRLAMSRFSDRYFDMVIFRPGNMVDQCVDSDRDTFTACLRLYNDYLERKHDVGKYELDQEWYNIHCEINEDMQGGTCLDLKSSGPVTCLNCLAEYIPERIELYRTSSVLVHVRLGELFLEVLNSINPEVSVEMYRDLVHYSGKNISRRVNGNR